MVRGVRCSWHGEKVRLLLGPCGLQSLSVLASLGQVCVSDNIPEAQVGPVRGTAATALGVRPESVAGIGLWGDGVPMTRNRNQSLEMLSWNILTHEDRAILRLPIFVIHKHWLAKNDAWDEVMRIHAWSLRHLAAGVLSQGALFGSRRRQRARSDKHA